jgi:lipoprotein-releasing system permease protein
MNSVILRMVRRYGRSRRGFTRVVTTFSVLGILLGVAALILVLAVMSGFRQELMNRILGVNGHMTLEVAGLTLPAAETLAATLQQLPGVERVTPYASGQVMLSANGQASGALVRGLLPGQLPPMVQSNVLASTDGVLSGQPAVGTVLVGQGVARQLGLMPGSPVQLIAPTGARTPMGFIPRMAQLQVAAVFQVGMAQIDNGLVLANVADVQRLNRQGDLVNALELRLTDPMQAEALVPQVEAASLPFAGGDPVNVAISTWQTTNGEFFRALQVERLTMFIILSLIILVAGFNIITGQMMLVNDKLADIAILRTMGATQGQIRTIFLLNGLWLGGLGTLGGVAIGLLGVWQMPALVEGIRWLTGVNLFPQDVYFLTELPSRLSMLDLGSVVGLALGLTLFASLWPAIRAARLNPVELLRRG